MNDLCRSVRTSIIDDEDMEALLQREHGANDFLDVLYLVVGGDDDNTVALIHDFTPMLFFHHDVL